LVVGNVRVEFFDPSQQFAAGRVFIPNHETEYKHHDEFALRRACKVRGGNQMFNTRL
jgi:hypothetical protein